MPVYQMNSSNRHSNFVLRSLNTVEYFLQMSTQALVEIAVPVDQNIIRTEEKKVEEAESSVWNQKDSWSLESHHNTYRDWWSWKNIEKS